MFEPRFRTPTLVVLTALVALCLGLLWGGHPGSLPGFLRDVFVNNDDAVRTELIKDIQDQYYKPVSKSRLEQASLAGIVNALGDRFSQYFTPAETKVFNQQLSGQFEGVGMKVDDTRSGTSGLFVSDVFKGSPAAQAGIHKGDRIVAVDGKSILHENPQVAVTRIRGPAGTTVKLTYRKGGTGTPRTVTVVRKRLNVPLVDARIITRSGVKVGYDLLAEFDKGAHTQLRAEIDSQIHQGARGILLDLRGDPGGELDEGVDVASIFLNKGLLVVSTRGRSQPESKRYASGNPIPARIPLVVLVDGQTASSAEIVTGALRDHNRATVAGTQTFGKGVFQTIEPLSNDGLLKLTVGSYFLPDGENLAGHGIVPPVRAVDQPKTKQRDEALDTAVATLLKKLP